MGNLNLKLTGIVAAAVLLLSPVANAQLSISLDDNAGNTAVETDTLNTGEITFTGALGNWTNNFTAAFGAPALGSPWMDELDLLSGNISGGTGTMTVMLTQTDLTRADASWLIGFGGTTDGSISFQSWIDTGNNAFGLGTLLTDSGSMGGLGFSGEDSGSLSMSGPYSWTVIATIEHAAGRNISSFDYNVKIPEPSSLALLGLGLLGAGFATRRKVNKTA